MPWIIRILLKPFTAILFEIATIPYVLILQVLFLSICSCIGFISPSLARKIANGAFDLYEKHCLKKRPVLAPTLPSHPVSSDSFREQNDH